MFETAVVRTRIHRRRFSLLTFSLTAHSVVITAVVLATFASIHLPDQAPKQMLALYRSAPPPALGESRPMPVAKTPAAVRHAPAVAPTVIPEMLSTSSNTVPETGVGEPAETGIPTGVEGEIGTEAPALANTAPDAAGPLPIANGVKAPVVIRRIEPIYPPIALRAHIPGTVVL